MLFNTTSNKQSKQGCKQSTYFHSVHYLCWLSLQEVGNKCEKEAEVD